MANKGKLLFVDDSPTMLDAIKSRLMRDGYDVQTTTSVTAAERLVQDRDIVVIDFHMPGMRGNEALAALRKLTAGRPTPCRYYLYTTDKATGASFREYGFDGLYTLKGDLDALARQAEASMRLVLTAQKLRGIAR